MRVLFFHDPVPELGRPFLWKYFVQWSTRMRRALPGCECRFLMADHMRRWAEESGAPPEEIVTLREEEFREASGVDPVNWNRYWFDGWFGPEEAASVGSFVGEGLGGFVPEVVLTHTPAPFLRAMWPQAVLLHYEAGLLKFPPFPMSFYLDPDGFFGQSYLARHAAELRRCRLSEDQQARLDRLRERFVDQLLVAKSPFGAVMARYDERFPRRLLLPLQFGSFFGFDSQCPFRSQFEYARWVLERTPGDIGVVLTQHIYFEQLEEEAIAFLRAEFPNLIYEPVFDDYNTASQFLLGHVDAVVTVTSSVGMQSLWWRKPLIAVGGSHLAAVRDGDDPADAHAILAAGWQPWKDGLFYWLLSHYYIPESYVYSDSWLPGFLERMRDGQGFAPIDDEERLMNSIAAGAVVDIGKPQGNRLRALEAAAEERLQALLEMKAEADRRARLIDELTEALHQKNRRFWQR